LISSIIFGMSALIKISNFEVVFFIKSNKI